MASSMDHIKGKIILRAQLVAQDRQAEKLQSLLVAIRDLAVSDKEPGCLTYRVSRSGNDFLVFEEYENGDAAKFHLDAQPFKNLLAEVQNGTLLAKEMEAGFYEEVA
ncbi:hypothetical protein BDV93DRAFT_607533 [Ceratobasidium sp. AG-I]|nr:hypothetical protein BDV93DRAFT_607533 [Ceratobasidium sp. AG-I]